MEEWGVGQSERQIGVICLGVSERHRKNVKEGSTEREKWGVQRQREQERLGVGGQKQKNKPEKSWEGLRQPDRPG